MISCIGNLNGRNMCKTGQMMQDQRFESKESKEEDEENAPSHLRATSVSKKRSILLNRRITF